jgi:hypothetical protein
LLVAGAAFVVVKKKLFRPRADQQSHAPVLVTAPPPMTAEEQAALMAGATQPMRPVWSLIDHVSLYHRAGFVEHYGADFRERRHRPIALDHTVLHVTAAEAWLLWWPAHTPSGDNAELLEVAFAGAVPAEGLVTVGVLMKSGDIFLFGHDFGGSRSSADALPFFPQEVIDAFQRTPVAQPMGLVDGKLRARLPHALREQLHPDGDDAVRCWFVCVAGCMGADVAFDHVSLLSPGAHTPGDVVTLGGTIRGGNADELTAVLESGEVRRQPLAGDGRFSLGGVPAGMPVSLRVKREHEDCYATLGRWFMAGGDRTDLVIDLSPTYVNDDRHKPDPKERVANMAARPGYSEMYAVHSRQIWNGPEDREQIFAGKSFSNNIGHLDRDRFYDNPDRCFRVVHLGSSHAVASQVRPCDRYNILMEGELGVRLGRPVEVVSLGRNNGDVAANYIRVRDFAVKFRPDVILLEHGSFLMMQTHPELLKRMHGYDPAHTHLDNFYYDDKGVLMHRPSCADWPLYVQKADLSKLIAGVPFYDTLRVPYTHMHPWGKESFKYLKDILRYYHTQFPDQKIWLHTGLDQAQAYGKYGRTAKLADDTVVPVGVEVFMEHMKDFCAREGEVCIQPALPQGFGDTPETYLTFRSDGHYCPRGHQWLARELSTGIATRVDGK